LPVTLPAVSVRLVAVIAWFKFTPTLLLKVRPLTVGEDMDDQAPPVTATAAFALRVSEVTLATEATEPMYVPALFKSASPTSALVKEVPEPVTLVDDVVVVIVPAAAGIYDQAPAVTGTAPFTARVIEVVLATEATVPMNVPALLKIGEPTNALVKEVPTPVTAFVDAVVVIVPTPDVTELLYINPMV